MDQLIIWVCLIASGYLAWIKTGNIVVTILGVVLGGFIGSLIGFQIHEARRRRSLGFSTREEMRAYDQEMREMKNSFQDSTDGFASWDEYIEEYEKRHKTDGHSSHNE